MIELETTRGNRYLLDDSGAVVARSNGPKGWDYSGQWIILGAATRWNSRHWVSLPEIIDGADFGQGWIHDLDHGTHRSWGMERLKSARRISAERETLLRDIWKVPNEVTR